MIAFGSLRYRRDRLARRIAAFLPARVVYHAAIRVAVLASSGVHSHQIVPDLTAMDAVKRWGHHHGMPGHGSA